MNTLEFKVEAVRRPNVDVLVVGAGPAGIAAAVSSARNGAKTLLVERYGYVGGNLTAGLVGPCMTSYSLDGRHQLIRGVFEELVLRMEANGGAIHPSKVPANSAYCGYITYGHDKVTPFDAEALKWEAAAMCQEAGVDLLLHSTMVETLTSGDRVTGIVVAGKSGFAAIQAGVVVDCSADADVIARGGGETRTGRDSDGLTQPMTLFFRVGNVDDDAVETYVRQAGETRPFASVIEAARAEGRYSIQRRGIGIYRTLQPGVWRVNTTRVQGVDGTCVDDLTRAEVEGRRQVQALMSFFRDRIAGFRDAVLIDTAATIGVRETRRIAGVYTLTLDDLTTGREFDDVIALCGYPVDIHSPTDAGGRLEEDPTANVYQIPYRVLVPARLDGVLAAGRCVSATHEALAAIRVMPPAFAMGQAAGTAAALATRYGIAPRDVDTRELQALLRNDAAYLGDR
ncbi:FAD-dependent oxidoreductase [Occultella aeris]|uniref:Putative FAD-binding dehydrogenase n=1 Tax=Occultella aeris TaxID=2761496 RepID=A0A7M4DGF1_9MICO|nr:FAD-dependent oxidoreductase [Occultella aeris]VZO35994.1 putative FAD-binding dehydrogenase [Occultella aeris]